MWQNTKNLRTGYTQYHSIEYLSKSTKKKIKQAEVAAKKITELRKAKKKN